MNSFTDKQLESARWTYRNEGKRKLRYAQIDGHQVEQRRIVTCENSYSNLMKKAADGLYPYSNLKITGAGDSFLVIGWETTSAVPINYLADRKNQS